jgi:xanthosine phosphorylase
MADADLATISAAAAAILRHTGDAPPRLAMVLGSGLTGIADAIEPGAIVPYGELPGFPASRVMGHRNELRLGKLAGLPVACLVGRAHFYESGNVGAMAVPIRALRRAGVEMILLTNAAGSLRPEIGPGRLMLIEDHINLMGTNPLIGANDERIGPRFPSLLEAYDPELRRLLRDSATALGIDLAAGTYLACTGPSFETPAEIRAFQRLGADAVGMSTVPETILARHCGMRVAGLSVITNLGEGLGDAALSHAETLAVAERAAGDVVRLIAAFCSKLANG